MNRKALLLVFAAALAAHLRSVACGFVYDDPFAILGNAVVTGPLDLGALLRRDFWGIEAGHGVGTWRPLPVLTFWLDWHAAGGSAWLFHLTSVVLHALAAVALAAASRRPLAGVIFAVLAVNSEAVDAIVGRADVMAAGLCFLAWALARRNMAAAALAWLAALLCKESAIVFPIWFLCVERPRPRHAAWLGALAAYLALRAATFGLGAEDVLRTVNNNPLVGEPLIVRVLTAPALLVRAVRLILFPLQLSPDYSWSEILPEHGASADVLTGAAVLAALVAGALFLRRRSPDAARGLTIFLAGWLAVANVVALLPAIFAERLLYLPAAGAALALAAGLRALFARARLAAIVLGTLLIAGNLARSVVRAGDWRDELALFTSAVEAAPRSARNHTNLGAALRAAHRPEEALVALARAGELAPTWALPRSLAGITLDDLGAVTAAERQLHQAIALDPELPDAAFNLGLFYARHGRREEAEEVLREFAARHPEATRVAALLADVESRGK